MDQRIKSPMQCDYPMARWGCRALAALGAIAMTAALAVFPFNAARAVIVAPDNGIQALIAALAAQEARNSAAVMPGQGVLSGAPLRSADTKPLQSLGSYQAVVNALMKGERLSLTVDLATCRNEADGRAGPVVRGGLHIDSYMVKPDQTLAFSDAHETLRETPPGSGEYMAVTEYLRYRLMPDGVVKLHIAQRLGMSDQPIKDKKIYRCQLGHGVIFMRTPR
ncbi:VirK family protein [Bordetella sp. LUAb4]|uniref:VirK family protein n=1 Tax=Bordetella sp. LUAb4 TaxID=2843195 RepID=UPI001E5BF144|nr:VirK family protein [Bordetella sp. LUAb4]